MFASVKKPIKYLPMKKLLLLSLCFLLITTSLTAQNFVYPGNWGKQGFNLVESKSDMVQVVYSVQNFSADPLTLFGHSLKKINLPGTFLFNDAGKPDLPGSGRYIAIPLGSTPHVRIVASETETIREIDVAWAPEIPLDTEKEIVYKRDDAVYSSNVNYPVNPVQISEVQHIRGVDVVILGITPFQYNPVSKELVVYKNLRIELTFEGGNGTPENDAFRSPYWDPIMADNILNFSSLPVINYPERMRQIRDSKSALSDECEYIIISPNGQDFLNWADSLKNWRNQQGILTRVYTLNDIGGNTESAIKNFINTAYNSWTIKPVACLLLGDYGTDANKNITSHLYTHPDSYPNFASDNYYADVNGDEMPDVVFSRIAANDASQLQKMAGRILDFERNRPVDTGYYMHPISALGWEDDRWFQLCSETVGGFWTHILGKHVTRINSLYTPANNYQNGPWSTATNTSTVVNYFGPSGLNYIPAIPGTLGGFTGGNATKINNAINAGSFVLLHRDHGAYTLWGEPEYTTSNIQQLTNTLLPFVFSINCETGAYHNPSGCPSACFQEVFQRMTANGHNAGALGLICPTETSYSFVNDTYLWGVMDNMWPDFMPAYGSTPTSRGLLPCFANAAGKYFLKQSSWPYNSSSKLVTYRLFHMHGDAFLQLADTVPVNLAVVHDTTTDYGTTSVNVMADDNAFIALTVNNEIIATAYGSSSVPVSITIPVLPVGTRIMVVVTKQNYKRHTSFILVIEPILTADFTASSTSVCQGASVDFSDLSGGNATGWQWIFQGGNPSSSDQKNPTGILYDNPGSYGVSLIVTKPGADPDTIERLAYMNVYELPVPAYSTSGVCAGSATAFTDQTSHPGVTITSWVWNFGDGDNSILQNPEHTYASAGTYTIDLKIVSSGGCSVIKSNALSIITQPGKPLTPVGDTAVCNGTTDLHYTVPDVLSSASYAWSLIPANAGIIEGMANTANLTIHSTFSGLMSIQVQAVNECGAGELSDMLPVNVTTIPDMATMPEGADSVNTDGLLIYDYTTAGSPTATGYRWMIDPATAGVVTGDQLTGTVSWTHEFSGIAQVGVVSGNDCGEAAEPALKTVVLYSTAGINDPGPYAFGFDVYPNPSDGKFTIRFTGHSLVNIGIILYNSMGMNIMEEKGLITPGKNSKVIDLSNQASGIYYIKVQSEEMTLIRKLVIRK
jgi:PKD repeat protein